MTGGSRIARLSRADLLRGIGGASLALAAGCQTTPPTVAYTKGSAASPTAFGSQLYPSDNVARDIALLGELGATYARVSVQVDQAFLDALFAAAAPAGMRVVLLSSYATQPVNIAAYASAAAAVHARYASHDPVWEIWNEPNLQQYWGAPPDIGTYVKLFAATAQALKAAGATQVWTGGTSGVDVNWIAGLVQRGAFTNATGCAVHSYEPPGNAESKYTNVLHLLPAGIPIHTTETCVPSSSNQSDFFNQMWYLHRGLSLPTMLWCELIDGGAGSAPPYNESYGLVDSGYNPKPVFAVARADVASQAMSAPSPGPSATP